MLQIILYDGVYHNYILGISKINIYLLHFHKNEEKKYIILYIKYNIIQSCEYIPEFEQSFIFQPY